MFNFSQMPIYAPMKPPTTFYQLQSNCVGHYIYKEILEAHEISRIVSASVLK